MIAEAWHGTQKRLFLRVVADRAACGEHGLAEHRVTDAGLAPDRGHQFVASDRAVAMLHEISDAVEHRRREFDACAAAFEFTRGDVERAVAEAQ